MARRSEPERTRAQRLLFGLLAFGAAGLIGLLVWWYASDPSLVRWIFTTAVGLIGSAVSYWWLASVGHRPRLWRQRRR